MKNTKQLIRDLSCNIPTVRLAAAIEIGNERVLEAVEPLRKLILDVDSDVQKAAIEALGKINNEESITVLLECLGKKSVTIKKITIETIKENKIYKALPALNQLCIYDPREEIRELANKALEKLNSVFDDLISDITKTLKNGNEKEKLEAIHILGSAGNEKAFDLLIQALNYDSIENKNAIIEELRKLVIVNIEPFCKYLKHDDPHIRALSVKMLGESRNNKALKFLIDALGDKDINVVRITCNALEGLRVQEALEPLKTLYYRADNQTKEFVLKSISKTGGEMAINIMIDILIHEKNPSVILEETIFETGEDALLPIAFKLDIMPEKNKKAAIRILNRYGDRVTDYFIGRLYEHDKNIKKASILALELTGISRAISPLEEFVNSEDKEISDAARKAVKIIRKKKESHSHQSFLGKLFKKVKINVQNLFLLNEQQKEQLMEQAKTSAPVCGKCGNIISLYKTTLLGADGGRNLGYCSLCLKFYCRDCSILILEGIKSTLKCPKCNVELDKAP